MSSQTNDPLALSQSFDDPPGRRADQIEACAAQQEANGQPIRGLHQRFEECVQLHPDRIALRYRDRALTYAELDQQANRLAHYLVGKGTQAEARIGVALDRSPEMVVALLAILKAGGAYVPVDPSYPTERVAFLVSDASPRLLLTNEAHVPRFKGIATEIVTLESARRAASDLPDARLACRSAATDLAYVIYTSGSTGTPKGVCIEHRHADALVLWAQTVFGPAELDGVLASTSINFDLSVFELFVPLSLGGSIILARNALTLREDVVDPKTIRLINTVPSAVRELLALHAIPESVETVNLAGEFLRQELVERLYALPHVQRVYDLYGPTEDTTYSTCTLRKPGGTPNIGRPLPDTRAYVLDAQRRPVPFGTKGELYLSGAKLARGYLHRPELTRERFVDNPFSTDPARKTMYRTGDCVRCLPDGTLEYLGRLDSQVKIRGYRVELGEIESALRTHAAVSDCVVSCVDDGQDQKRIVAHWLAALGGAGTASGELRRHLAAVLPEHMIPTAFMELSQFPRTPNGKLDRSALPLPSPAPPTPSAAPESATERYVAGVLQSLLGLPTIGRHDHFFQLGGDSLRAARFAAQVFDDCGVELTMSALRDHPTVAAMADHLDRQVPHSTDRTKPWVPRRYLPEEPFALTDLQQAYWVGRSPSHELGNVSCHVYQEHDVRELDPARLGTALHRLVARHEALRIEILETGQQRIREHVPRLTLPCEDLRSLDAEARDARLAAKRYALAHRMLPHDRAPLLDCQLTRVDDTTTRVHWTFDLLVLDYWSLTLLSRELEQLYANPNAELAPLAIGLRDCLRALEHRKTTEAYRASLAYWKPRLESLPPPPRLPLAKPLSEIRKPIFRRRRENVSAADRRRLADLAAHAGVTLPVLILAAFSEVLRTWSAARSFTLDLTVLDRDLGHPQVASIVGDFTGVELLEIQGHGATFLERIQEVQSQLWRDLDHQRVSGVELLRERARMRDEHGKAQMPVVFTCTLHETIDGQEPLAWLGVEAYGLTQTPQVAFDHQVRDAGDGLALIWDCVEELYAERMLDDMFAAYRQLIKALCADEVVLASQHVVALPSHMRARIDEANATRRPLDSTLLHELLSAGRAAHPHAPAVISSTQTITYAELDDAAGRLALRLRGAGAVPNRLVAVVMEKGWEQVLAVVAILKAGAAYLPLDPATPAERRRAILREAEVQCVLTQPQWISEIAQDGVAHTWPITDEALRAKGPSKILASVQRPSDLAYVIYTSGSTGKPKGVMISHRGAVNTIVDLVERFGLSTDGGQTPDLGRGPPMGERCLALSSLSFDLSVFDIFGMLACGGAIVLPDANRQRDPEHWEALIQQHSVSLWNSVPALMEMLLQHLEGKGAVLPKTLRNLWLSGDWIPVRLAERLLELAPGAKLTSLGGATEASIWSILYTVDRVDAHWKSIPYGRPLANQTFHVLDDRLAPKPIGVPGRLYIGGAGVAAGYWADVERTAERFVLDEASAERLYWTGDLGRYLPDGNIEFLGREDFQVKVQGYRIELEEIESAVGRHPHVERGVVAVDTLAHGGKRLVGYVVPRAGLEISSPELVRFLSEQLPDYMVPKVWVTIDRVPLTDNGKVCRDRLPKASTEGASDEAPSAPSSDAHPEIVERLVEIWKDVLRVPQVVASDHFFRLGGDSIAAVTLTAQIRREFSASLPLQALFDHPTLGSLAAAIAATPPPATADPAPTGFQLTPDLPRRHEPFALTEVQQAYRLGRTDAFVMGGVGCHGYWEYDSSDLDLDRLRRAWRSVIARHEMLRAVIQDDGTQRILPFAELPPIEIEIRDYSGISDSERERRLATLRDQLSHRTLPLDRAPIFGLSVTRLGPRRCRVHWDADLIVLDYWSYFIVTSELARFYEDPRACLPDLELSFRDYVIASERFRLSDEFGRSLRYWKKRASEIAPAPDLPLATSPDKLGTPRFHRIRRSLDAAHWSALKSWAQARELTPSAVLLTLFAEVIGRWSASSVFTLNLTLFQRKPVHPQIQEVVGDFTVVSLLTVDTGGDDSFEERARRIQRRLWEDLDHSDVSGVEVLREVSRAKGGAGNNLMPVVFTSGLFAGRLDDVRPLAFLGEEVFGISQTPQVWLDHRATEIEGVLVYDWDYAKDLFPQDLIADMGEAYQQALVGLSDRPELASGRRSLVTLPEGQSAVRAAVNQTDGAPPTATLYGLFAQAAEATPESVAVIHGSRAMRYSEVDRLATHYAAELLRLQVAPNTLVAVVMEKGWEQVAAVLAILQAGAAYVPIDATLPDQRIRTLLELAEARVALTQPRFAEGHGWQRGCRVLCVTDPPEVDSRQAAATMVAARSTDLAYVIYTSGSTGVPKGVMIDHRGAVNTLRDLQRRFALTPHDRTLALSSLSFDLSVFDLFGAFACGGAVVIPDADRQNDPDHWRDLLHAHRVTIWNSVPALMGMLVDHLCAREARLPEALRHVWMSGDWIPVTLPDRIRSLHPTVRMTSLGGATEASIWSILHPIDTVEPSWTSIPYGRPMTNQRFFVLDRRMAPSPNWVPGRLYIGGLGLAQGYWRDEPRTAERFVAHPDSGERLYWTGDLGRYWSDGTLEFLGREDLQVKVQGYRIELEEIEAALLKHPRVAAAAVGVFDAAGEAQGKRLVGYTVTGQGAPLSGAELRTHLGTLLPDYMIPKAWVALHELPLTANGKVDRRTLPAPTSERHIEQEVRAAPGVTLARSSAVLSEVWTRLLEVDSVSAEDTFFESGGDSVSASRLVNELRKRLGIELSLREVLGSKSFSELAALVESRCPPETATAVEEPTAPPPTQSYIAELSAPRELPAASAWTPAPAMQHLQDPLEKLRFKLRNVPVKSLAPQGSVELPDTDGFGEEVLASRRTIRRFLRRTVHLRELGKLLSSLRRATLPGYPFYKAGYASGGGLYPVQAYLYVKPDRVEGICSGLYYYSPIEHRLGLVNRHVVVTSADFDDTNGAVFDDGAFAIYLVAELQAILPIYPQWAHEFCLMEAGAVCHQLELAGAGSHLGLCQIGGLKLGRLEREFRLSPTQRFLHCLVAGPVAESAYSVAALADESRPLRALTEAMAASDSTPRAQSSADGASAYEQGAVR